MTFNSVIFDFDYTLADSSLGVIDCVNQSLRRMQLADAADDDIRATIGLSIRETFRSLTKRPSPSEAEEFARLFALRADEVMLDNTFLFDSARPSIESLLDRGKRLAIVTSKFRYRIEAFLKREGLTSAFGVVVGAEDVSELKPSPAGLLLALKGLGSLKHHTVYVGDNIVDAEAAARAGLPFIAVLSGVTAADAFRRHKTHSIIRDLNGLCKALEKPES